MQWRAFGGAGRRVFGYPRALQGDSRRDGPSTLGEGAFCSWWTGTYNGLEMPLRPIFDERS